MINSVLYFLSLVVVEHLLHHPNPADQSQSVPLHTMNISFIKIILVFSLPNVRQERFPVSRSSLSRVRDRLISRKLARKPPLEVRRRPVVQLQPPSLPKVLDGVVRLGSLSGKPSKSVGQDKQLFLTSPRPPFPMRLNPAALLIPAIPTVLGLIAHHL